MPDEKCILDPQMDCLGLHKANMLEKQAVLAAVIAFVLARIGL